MSARAVSICKFTFATLHDLYVKKQVRMDAAYFPAQLSLSLLKIKLIRHIHK